MEGKKIIFENGREFLGKGFGANVDVVREVVFNTSMVGYQEVLSDPSYFGQIVCMTYPLIGNYGLTDEDYEASRPAASGFIVREYNDKPSNYRYTKTLNECLKDYKIPGISDIDTREVTKMIRDEGSMRALITSEKTKLEDGIKVIREAKKISNHVRIVSSKKPWYQRSENHKCTVAILDCGVKLNIIRLLTKKKCNVVVLPYNTKKEEILKFKPDGILISNGPGDPRDLKEIKKTIRGLQGSLPIFGICLGHQLIALANGADVYKMRFGHRGSNHPVKNLKTNKVEITSQNHSYSVDSDSLKNTRFTPTHKNLLDNTVEGIEIVEDKVFSVQYHPESAPGPQDSSYLFDQFIELL